jgi:hypothetical protein
VLSLISAWPIYFDEIAKDGRFILVEKQRYAGGRPKPDLTTIKEADGRDLVRLTERGFFSSRLEVPAEVFRYFINSGLVCQSSSGDKAIFRLVPDAMRLAAQLGLESARPS